MDIPATNNRLVATENRQDPVNFKLFMGLCETGRRINLEHVKMNRYPDGKDDAGAMHKLLRSIISALIVGLICLLLVLLLGPKEKTGIHGKIIEQTTYSSYDGKYKTVVTKYQDGTVEEKRVDQTQE